MKHYKIISLILILCMLTPVICIPAFAASSDISLGGTRNSSSGDAWASCYASGTTSTMVVASVYKNGSRVKYLSNSGTNYGYVDFAGVSNDSMKVSGSANTNGTYYSATPRWYYTS